MKLIHHLITPLAIITLSSCLTAQTPDQRQPPPATPSSTQPAAAQSPASSRKAAIFIINRGDKSLNDEAPIFEDLLTAKITDQGFAVISRELVLNAVADLLKRDQKNSADQIFSDQTSALRLSQNLGADYLIIGTLTSFEKATRKVNAYNVNFEKQTFTLRTTYRILDGYTGAAITADSVVTEKSVQQDKYSQTDAPDLIRSLLDTATNEMATTVGLKVQQGTIRTVERDLAQSKFSVAVSLSDMNIPEVIFDEKGEAKVTGNTIAIQPLAVTVEIDGIVIGTTGTGGAVTTLNTVRGFHRMRLTREDLMSWERTVNIQDGTTLNIAMQFSPAGLQRWQENTKFLSSLKKDSILNRAEAAKLRGEAKQLENSGYKIDLKMDTDKPISLGTTNNLLK